MQQNLHIKKSLDTHQVVRKTLSIKAKRLSGEVDNVVPKIDLEKTNKKSNEVIRTRRENNKSLEKISNMSSFKNKQALAQEVFKSECKNK